MGYSKLAGRGVVFKIATAVSIIFIITCLCYHGVLKNSFVSDTIVYLVDNPFITSFSLSNLKWMMTTMYHSNWHPVTWLSFSLDYWMYDGLKTWGFHLTNILIHGINCGLLFLLTLLVLGLYHPVKRFRYPVNFENKVLISAFISTLLFAIHPQRVESVAWVAERKDVLFLFFLLSSFLAYWAYVFRYAKYRRRWYLLSLLSFFLSISSKPMAVTLPVLLLIIDVYPLRRTTVAQSDTALLSPMPIRWILLEKVPFFLISGIVILLTLNAQSDASHAIVDLPLLDRVTNACNSIIFYIRKFVFPIGLSPLYVHPKLMTKVINTSFYLPIMACVLITIIAIYQWHQNKHAMLTSWLFYLVSLSPILGIIQVGIQAAADRYTYSPMLPFYFFIAVGIFTLLTRISSNVRAFVIGATFAVLILMSWLTQQQVKIWRNSVSLWFHAAQVSPDNGFARGNLGGALYNVGYYEEAHNHFEWAHKNKQLSVDLIGGYILNSIALENFIKVIELNMTVLIQYDRHAPFISFGTDCLIYNIGWGYYGLGHYDQARHWLEKINPASSYFVDATGLIDAIRNDNVEALDFPSACRRIGILSAGGRSKQL